VVACEAHVSALSDRSPLSQGAEPCHRCNDDLRAANRQLAPLGADQAESTTQPGDNMEGKEARYGVAESALCHLLGQPTFFERVVFKRPWQRIPRSAGVDHSLKWGIRFDQHRPSLSTLLIHL
jgi:hypothetical protein